MTRKELVRPYGRASSFQFSEHQKHHIIMAKVKLSEDYNGLFVDYKDCKKGETVDVSDENANRLKVAGLTAKKASTKKAK